MVGRPGRSKGCFNCRRRKKGCDLARPQCGQCIKSKSKCAGYNDDLDVVVYTPLASRSHVSLQSTAVEVKYIDTFWELLLPTMSRASQTSNRDWTRVIRDRYSSDGSLRNAMLALAFSRVGQYSANSSVARSGAVHYNDALREVARKIDVQKGAWNDEVLAVCLIMSLYEVMCSPAEQGINWQRHIRGIGILMELRGPHGFTSGISHILFASARLDVIFAALVSRKATFLDSYDWLSVPWSTASTPKSLYDKIVDLCAQIPRVLNMLDQIHIAKSPQIADSEALLSACWRLDSELQEWHRELVMTCALTHVNPAGLPHTALDIDGPLRANTEINHEHAQALSIYWMTCCFLYTTLRLVWQASENPLYLLPHRIDPLRYASLISRSLPYFSAPSAGEGSLIYYSMSIGAALHCLSVSGQFGTPDSQRLTRIFDSQEDPRGIGNRVGMFLKTLAAASVECKISLEPADWYYPDEDEIARLGKKWWGGGTDEVTLRPRRPSAKVAVDLWQGPEGSPSTAL